MVQEERGSEHTVQVTINGAPFLSFSFLFVYPILSGGALIMIDEK
jgi:hypothetical protein